MSSQPAAHFQATNTSLIRLAVEALATAPHLTAAEKQVRSEAVICGIMAFLPSEPVQTMLASQVVGQHLLALDTFREIFHRGLTENGSVRLRSTAAMCTRSTLSLMREIRVARAAHDAAVLADQAAADAHAARQAAAAAADQWEAEEEDGTEGVQAAPAPAAERAPDAAAAVGTVAADRTAEPTRAAEAVRTGEAVAPAARIAVPPARAASEAPRPSFPTVAAGIAASPGPGARADGAGADGSGAGAAPAREKIQSDALLPAAGCG